LLFQPSFSQSSRTYPATGGKPSLRQSADWVRNAVIYEVYLRSFSREGTFRGLEKRLPELKDLGVTVIWLMPIHPVGELKRKGHLGSPYAVRDYYAVNPEFGTLEDFRSLVRSVHNTGMHIIIDLVINHTAWDNPLITEHPDWYTHDEKREIVSPNKDWTDVADLDYSRQGLRDYMTGMMVYWVRDIGIDGYRCDVAELLPTDFW
jgi:glycosidase